MPILARYAGLFVQFLLVVAVADRLGQGDAGIYFVSFGIVATLFAVSGLAVPDGLVKTVGECVAKGDLKKVRSTITFGLKFTMLSCILIGLASWLGFSGLVVNATVIPLVIAWWFCYSIVFFCSQALVAIHHPVLGSFIFYTSTNLCFLVTSVPYLLIAESPSLENLMSISVFGSAMSLVLSLWVLYQKLKIYPALDRLELSYVLLEGTPVAISRFLQASIYWIPVWVAGYVLSTQEAAAVGAASRLLVAFSALIAAIRFSVRSKILSLAANDNWRELEVLARKISAFSIAVVLLSLLMIGWLGDAVVLMLFGEEYAAVIPILLVLMIGTLGESIGGIVDEILKMTGYSRTVLNGLVFTVLAETITCVYLSQFGILYLVLGQSLAFFFMYSYQVYALKSRAGINCLPIHGWKD